MHRLLYIFFFCVMLAAIASISAAYLLGPAAAKEPRLPDTMAQSNETNSTERNVALDKDLQNSNKLGFFDYADIEHGMRARVYLPESLGNWNVENPWRVAGKSLTKQLGLFVKVNFQSADHPKFYGLLRVVYDLQGYDCGVLFSKLAESDGLALEKYTDSECLSGEIIRDCTVFST